jgi:hypothetical protein
MKVLALAAVCTIMAGVAAADLPWRFGEVVEVAGSHSGRFHHLESSGRRNIAVSAGTIAITWEDNRNGHPQVYVAFKAPADTAFGPATRVSNGGEAYEPTIMPLHGGSFLVGWEEAGHVNVREVAPTGIGPVSAPSRAPSSQISLSAETGVTHYAAWTDVSRSPSRVVATELRRGEDGSYPWAESCHLDPLPAVALQQYPAIALTRSGRAMAVWENRRDGRTELMTSYADSTCRFDNVRRLNDWIAPTSKVYGRGIGVARPAVAPFGTRGVAVTWADKRDFRTGYDVYALLSTDGGKTLGPNTRVQDEFADLIEQWHPAIAADRAGLVVVAWDDTRDGTSDIWLSWQTPDGWSDDVAVPAASGSGEESHPTLTLEDSGNLHIAWVVRPRPLAPTRVLYVSGTSRTVISGAK